MILPTREHIPFTPRWVIAATASVVALACGLGGCSHASCATRAVPLRECATTDTAAAVEADAEFPGSGTILNGFDLADGPVQWRIGDRVLLGIRFTNHDVRTERMLLVELTDSLAAGDGMTFKASSKDRPYVLESDVVNTRLTLFDERGRQLDTATGRFPVKLLGFGLYDGAKWSIGTSGPSALSNTAESLSEVDHDRMMRGWLTLFSFSGSLNRKGMFQEMMRAVVARPTLLAMLFNPSVSMMSQSPGPSQADPWKPTGCNTEATVDGIETIEVPITLSIAGKSGLIGSVTAARPVAPLSLCGGVLRASARNADDPCVHVEIRLLAAARGNGGQELGSH